MKLQDYLLTLYMEESSEAIKAAGLMIRQGKDYRFSRYGNMTAEDIFYSEFGDCLASIILLRLSGISVAPKTVEFLLNKDESVLKEMEIRIENILSITEKNIEGLELDGEEFKKFKGEVEEIFSKSRKEIENREKGEEDRDGRMIISKKY